MLYTICGRKQNVLPLSYFSYSETVEGIVHKLWNYLVRLFQYYCCQCVFFVTLCLRKDSDSVCVLVLRLLDSSEGWGGARFDFFSLLCVLDVINCEPGPAWAKWESKCYIIWYEHECPQNGQKIRASAIPLKETNQHEMVRNRKWTMWCVFHFVLVAAAMAGKASLCFKWIWHLLLNSKPSATFILFSIGDLSCSQFHLAAVVSWIASTQFSGPVCSLLVSLMSIAYALYRWLTMPCFDDKHTRFHIIHNHLCFIFSLQKVNFILKWKWNQNFIQFSGFTVVYDFWILIT